MENKESSLRLSSSNASCNKRSFAEDLNHSTEDIEFFHKEYTAAMNAAAKWELDLDDRYSEDDALSIKGMLSYLENIECGFGHLNDEALFKSERQADSNGELYKEAVLGFTFSQKYIRLRR